MALLDDGRLLVSVAGSFSALGVSGADEDLMAFDGIAWSMYFDGSDVGLTSSDEDLDAIFVAPAAGNNPTLYFSTRGSFSVSGLSGRDEDAFGFAPTNLGNSTSGSFVAGLALDGSLYGLSSFDIDGFAVGAAPASLSSAGFDAAGVLETPSPKTSLKTTANAQISDALFAMLAQDNRSRGDQGHVRRPGSGPTAAAGTHDIGLLLQLLGAEEHALS